MYSDLEAVGLELREERDGLTLTDGRLSIRVDFRDLLPRLRQDRLRGELLVKAAKLKGASAPLRLIDATAGFGEDSLLLAAAGFHVTLYESNPVIAALLSDGLKRASEDEILAPIVSRMTMYPQDSCEAMRKTEESPQIVLLDPMFPERQKSALVKKKFQLIHKLEQPCSDETELFDAAVTAGPRKIIVKRPPKGPLLDQRKPSYSLTGKAVRYDVYLL